MLSHSFTLQVVVSSGQLVNVSQGQPMILQQINPTKATFATINGQQVLIRSNTGKLDGFSF